VKNSQKREKTETKKGSGKTDCTGARETQKIHRRERRSKGRQRENREIRKISTHKVEKRAKWVATRKKRIDGWALGHGGDRRPKTHNGDEMQKSDNVAWRAIQHGKRLKKN